MEHFHAIGYWAALLVALLETTVGVGLFLPGSSVLLFMGALAAKGYFDLGDLLWFAIAGAVIGDNINYFLGRKYGSRIFANGFLAIKPAYFEKGKEFFGRHGPKSVFIGRFIPSVKEVIPLIAGTFGMRRLPFVVWNVLGAVGWSLVWVLPGYFFVESLGLAKMWLTRAGFFLAVLASAFAVSYFLRAALIRKGREYFFLLSSVWRSVKRAIAENPDAREFAKRHEGFFKFARKRTDRGDFFGLPLTMFALTLLFALFLLGGVAEDVVNSDAIVSADVKIAGLLASFRDPRLTKFFLWVTVLGKWQAALFLSAGTALILWARKKKSQIIPLLLSVVGAGASVFAGKIAFHRPRPELAVYAERGFSFPSGHAAMAVAFYGFLAYLLIRNAKKWKKKVNIFFAAFIVAAFIGFSRLYLGVHYFSDVWAGYLTGAVWLIAAIGVSEYLSRAKRRNNEESKGERIIAGGAVIDSR